MGIVTNLITDMHVQGASTEEITRAVKHSMVIIDSEKHKLNWKLSEKVNGIEELKKKYQSNPDSKKIWWLQLYYQNWKCNIQVNN